MISFAEEGNTGLIYLRTFSGTLKLLILFLTIVPTGTKFNLKNYYHIINYDQ